MSTGQNKTIVRRYFEEVLNGRNLAAAEQLFAPGFGGDGFASHGPNSGPEKAKAAAMAFLTGFPDIHFTVEEMIAEGDKVVVRVSFRGTHQGQYMGIPATGRIVEVTGVELARLVNGQIVEEGWHYLDELNLLKQLGVLHHEGH